MPSWSLKLERQKFYGMEIISVSHVYVEEKILRDL
jgi:hypothetical protein